MLRITHQPGEEAEVLRLEGQLAGPWVPELRAAVEASLRRARRVGLDLFDVRYASNEGARLIQELVARGCEIVRSSSFVEELLRRTLP